VQKKEQLCRKKNNEKMRKNIKDKLIDAFYTQPEQWIHLRALARKTKASPNSLKPYLKQLVKQKIIEKRKKEKRIQYRPKLESAEYLWHKRVHNLKKIYESGIIKTLEEYYSPKAIILFGSYSRGEDIST